MHVELAESAAVVHNQSEILIELIGADLREQRVIALAMERDIAVDRLGVLQHLVVGLEGAAFIACAGLGARALSLG